MAWMRGAFVPVLVWALLCIGCSVKTAGSDPALSEPRFLSDLRAEEEKRTDAPIRVAAAGDPSGVGSEAESAQGASSESAGVPEGDEFSDPFEPLNRAFFEFNDKLYFWFLKPLATGYRTVVPEPVRVGIRNMFRNIVFPVRFVNALLQGKIEGAANEFARFVANSVVGLGGFLDVVPADCDIKRQEEDLGQTFGVWGMGPGFYIHWPFFGPSSLRDTIGRVGDGFLDPLNYVFPHTEYDIAAKVLDRVNDTSLRIGDYESLKDAALDPYVALRDAYHQNRRSKIAE